jgi:hypothetical protein
MIGSETMTLHGWRALAECSLEHSCMDSKQKSEVTAEWERRWNGFCQWIVDTYAEKYDVEDREDALFPASIGLETICKLGTNDAKVLEPIKVYGIAYTKWCQSKRYDVGDPERVSTLIHFDGPL